MINADKKKKNKLESVSLSHFTKNFPIIQGLKINNNSNTNYSSSSDMN